MQFLYNNRRCRIESLQWTEYVPINQLATILNEPSTTNKANLVDSLILQLNTVFARLDDSGTCSSTEQFTIQDIDKTLIALQRNPENDGQILDVLLLLPIKNVPVEQTPTGKHLEANPMQSAFYLFIFLMRLTDMIEHNTGPSAGHYARLQKRVNHINKIGQLRLLATIDCLRICSTPPTNQVEHQVTEWLTNNLADNSSFIKSFYSFDERSTKFTFQAGTILDYLKTVFLLDQDAHQQTIELMRHCEGFF